LRPAHSRRHLYVTSYTEGFSHFVTSMTAPVASGWSVRRVGLSPTGKRRLLTAHANSGRSSTAWRTCVTAPKPSTVLCKNQICTAGSDNKLLNSSRPVRRTQGRRIESLSQKNIGAVDARVHGAPACDGVDERQITQRPQDTCGMGYWRSPDNFVGSYRFSLSAFTLRICSRSEAILSFSRADLAWPTRLASRSAVFKRRQIAPDARLDLLHAALDRARARTTCRGN